MQRSVPGEAGGHPASRRLHTKASLVVAHDIVQVIYEAGMQPGDRYLSEAEGIRRHGVGRGTYREALRFLEHHGVITMRSGAGGGPEISSPGWPHLASTIALLLQFAGAPLRTILDARVAIEPGMAALAAANASAADVAAMADDLGRLERYIGNYPSFSDAYLSFWRHLANSTHNHLLAFLSPAMRAIVNSSGFVPNERYREKLLARLRTIHEAVAARDAAVASSEMHGLELEFKERLVEGYPRQVDRVISWSDLVYIG